jgi:predicted house-cleaning noncanonical NTP pyrophosphatase (MazG superfamily)
MHKVMINQKQKEVIKMKIDVDVKMRPALINFAENVETTLRKNDHKSGWKHESDNYLDSKLMEEVCEYLILTYDPLDILDSMIRYLQQAHNQKVDDALKSKRNEILDVGAVAMMIFDNTNDDIILKRDEE